MHNKTSTTDMTLQNGKYIYLDTVSPGIEAISKELNRQKPTYAFPHNEVELKRMALYCLTDDETFWPNSVPIEFKHKLFYCTEEEKLIMAGALIAAEYDSTYNLQEPIFTQKAKSVIEASNTVPLLPEHISLQSEQAESLPVDESQDKHESEKQENEESENVHPVKKRTRSKHK